VPPSVQRRKVWLTPNTRVPCSNATKKRNLLKFAGVPQALEPISAAEPLVGWSSPYCGDMWRRYCCLTSFFSDCRYMPHLRRHSPTKLCDGAQMAIFGVFWRFFASCIFSEPRAVHFRPAFEIRTRATPCVEVWYHHHHHIFVYSVVVTRNSSHRDKNYTKPKTVHKQYKYNCQLTELIAVFVEHSYEKVSVVKFGCLVE